MITCANDGVQEQFSFDSRMNARKSLHSQLPASGRGGAVRSGRETSEVSSKILQLLNKPVLMAGKPLEFGL